MNWGAEHRIWYRYDVALLLTEIERLRTAVNAVYGWTKQGDSTPDKLRVALLLVELPGVLGEGGEMIAAWAVCNASGEYLSVRDPKGWGPLVPSCVMDWDEADGLAKEYAADTVRLAVDIVEVRG